MNCPEGATLDFLAKLKINVLLKNHIIKYLLKKIVKIINNKV